MCRRVLAVRARILVGALPSSMVCTATVTGICTCGGTRPIDRALMSASTTGSGARSPRRSCERTRCATTAGSRVGQPRRPVLTTPNHTAATPRSSGIAGTGERAAAPATPPKQRATRVVSATAAGCKSLRHSILRTHDHRKELPPVPLRGHRQELPGYGGSNLPRGVGSTTAWLSSFARRQVSKFCHGRPLAASWRTEASRAQPRPRPRPIRALAGLAACGWPVAEVV